MFAPTLSKYLRADLTPLWLIIIVSTLDSMVLRGSFICASLFYTSRYNYWEEIIVAILSQIAHGVVVLS